MEIYEDSWNYLIPATADYDSERPFICPVCEGKGIMPTGFYPDIEKSKGPQKCRSCDGKGYVFSEKVKIDWPRYPYYPWYPVAPHWYEGPTYYISWHSGSAPLESKPS